MALNDDQKRLKKFIARRHPLYEAMAQHWAFLEETYEGGRGWFDGNIFKYMKEGDTEFAARLQRAYRFNHTHEVVDLVDKYLFKMEIQRQEEGTSDALKAFWKRATLAGGSITDFMKRLSNRASVFGRVWVVVDATNPNMPVQTRADEKEADLRRYAYTLTPLQVLDMSHDKEGELNWLLQFETRRDDEDPIDSDGKIVPRFRLWTRTDTRVWELQGQGDRAKVVEIPEEAVVHGLGVVPVIPVDNVISDNPYSSPAMIADVAYLDRAVANYLSNLDAIIQDQTFSQLIIPSGSVDGSDEEAHKKLVEMGTKRIFTYNGDGGGKPEFISPDVKQAQLILAVVNKIINEIYHSVGLAGERTKEDNALGIDNSSGVAKAYDFERVNSLLAAKADSLELAERRIAKLVMLWAGDADPEDDLPENLIHYPDNFDVRGLYDEFEIAARLAVIEAPDEVRREQMRTLIDKLFPQLTKELRSKMESELKGWPIKLEDLMAAAAPGAAASEGGGTQAVRKTSTNQVANQLVK